MYSAVNTPAMQNVTVRLHTRTIAELEREARDRGVSRSEHIRNTLETRDEHERLQREHERVRAAYEKEIAELHDRIEYLENRERVILDEREEKQELVRYVEDERTAAERWRHAGLLTKAKWAVTGMPEERD